MCQSRFGLLYTGYGGRGGGHSALAETLKSKQRMSAPPRVKGTCKGKGLVPTLVMLLA